MEKWNYHHLKVYMYKLSTYIYFNDLRKRGRRSLVHSACLPVLVCLSRLTLPNKLTSQWSPCLPPCFSFLNYMCCCSVAKSFPILCNLMDCGMPGVPVLYCLLEFAQTHVHWVDDAIQPTISSSVAFFSFCPQSFPASQSFPVSQLFTSGGQSTGASASVLPMNIQDWSPLGWSPPLGRVSLLSKGLSRVFSNTTVQKHQFLTVLSLFYGPALTTIHDYWKNYSFDYSDLCQQSDVSAF